MKRRLLVEDRTSCYRDGNEFILDSWNRLFKDIPRIF